MGTGRLRRISIIIQYRGYDHVTLLKTALYDLLELSITCHKPGLDLKVASLKSAAKHWRRTLRKEVKKKKKARFCLQEL